MVALNNILLEYIPDADGGFPIVTGYEARSYNRPLPFCSICRKAYGKSATS